MTVTTPQTKPAAVFPRLPDELLASTSFLLKRLGMVAKEQAIDAFEQLGVSPYHYAVLLVLDEGSRDTQGSIADALGYDRGQLVGVLDELEESNLVERRRDPSDRRRHIVRMTSGGKRTLTKMRAVMKRLDDEFFAPLDDAERATLQAILLRLAQQHDTRCAQMAAPSPPATRSAA